MEPKSHWLVSDFFLFFCVVVLFTKNKILIITEVSPAPEEETKESKEVNENKETQENTPEKETKEEQHQEIAGESKVVYSSFLLFFFAKVCV